MNALAQSVEHSYIGPRDVRAFQMKDARNFEALKKIGIGFDARDLERMYQYAVDGVGMDSSAITSPITTPSVTTLVQFLQNWLPGQVKVITAAREIDALVGIATVGSWADEEIVQEVLENIGDAVPYGDLTNVPFASWNLNYNKRTVVRFEKGLRVGRLEEERAGRQRVNSGETKRESAGLALEIQRNLVGFFGYNAGNNLTYGFLNDPSLPAYVTVAATGTGASTLWSQKTFLEICADIRTAIVGIRTNSKGNINPQLVPMTLALPTNAIDYLTVTSDFGISVWDWLRQTYPKIRVQDAIQLDSANGGVGVFYLYAESVNDLSTDDGRTFIQVVPAKFQLLGVQQMAKGYEEDYVNATAGVMCKRPYAVYRASGIS